MVNRYDHFDAWLESNDFDKLMYRIVYEHDYEYINACNHNGITPKINNKLTFIYSYVEDKLKPIKMNKLANRSANKIWEFKGYYFQIIYTGKLTHRIYNKEDLRLILEI